MKTSLKRLQIKRTNWGDLARDRPTWRKTEKTGTAIYEANRIPATKDKRETRKSQQRPPCSANNRPPPICPRCQWTFWAPILGPLRINCSTRTTPYAVSSSNSASSSTPATNSEPPQSSPPSPHLLPSILLLLLRHRINIRYGGSCTHNHCTQS
nr:unnamed protein product [Spirometra erinaceieuropaei]